MKFSNIILKIPTMKFYKQKKIFKLFNRSGNIRGRRIYIKKSFNLISLFKVVG